MRPHRWQPTRLPRPWDSPGKNTGVGCHFLLQCMKVKSESEIAQSCSTLSDPMDCSPPGSSVHGISRQEYWSGVPLPSPRPAINPSIPPLDLYQWEMKTCVHTKTCTLKFIAAFIIAEKGNNPTDYHLTNRWVKYSISRQWNINQPLKGMKYWYILQDRRTLKTLSSGLCALFPNWRNLWIN